MYYNIPFYIFEHFRTFKLDFDNKTRRKPDIGKQHTVLPLIARCRRHCTLHRWRRNLQQQQ